MVSRSWIRISVSNKSSGDADTVGPGTNDHESLIYASKPQMEVVPF